MDAVDLLVRWVSPIVAIVYVIGYSLLFDPIRKWKKWPALVSAFLDCPMCIGFWAGIFVGLVNWLPVGWPEWTVYVVLGGCLGVSLEYVLELMWRK